MTIHTDFAHLLSVVNASEAHLRKLDQRRARLTMFGAVVPFLIAGLAVFAALGMSEQQFKKIAQERQEVVIVAR